VSRERFDQGDDAVRLSVPIADQVHAHLDVKDCAVPVKAAVRSRGLALSQGASNYFPSLLPRSFRNHSVYGTAYHFLSAPSAQLLGGPVPELNAAIDVHGDNRDVQNV